MEIEKILQINTHFPMGCNDVHKELCICCKQRIVRYWGTFGNKKTYEEWGEISLFTLCIQGQKEAKYLRHMAHQRFIV